MLCIARIPFHFFFFFVLRCTPSQSRLAPLRSMSRTPWDTPPRRSLWASCTTSAGLSGAVGFQYLGCATRPCVVRAGTVRCGVNFVLCMPQEQDFQLRSEREGGREREEVMLRKNCRCSLSTNANYYRYTSYAIHRVSSGNVRV